MQERNMTHCLERGKIQNKFKTKKPCTFFFFFALLAHSNSIPKRKYNFKVNIPNTQCK